MADVRPFRGIHFNPNRLADLSNLLCPPFDVISSDMQQDLYRRSEFNAVRLELGREFAGDGEETNRYTRSGDTLREWLASEALVRDDAPSIYVLEEQFEFGGRRHTRRGLLSAVRLEPFEKGVVLAHESTRKGPKEDRLKLMKAARSNFSPLMALFRDDAERSVGRLIEETTGGEPTFTADPPDMPALKVWRVSDPGALATFVAAMREAQIYLADGHHRYETAIAYRDWLAESQEVPEDHPANFRMMSLIPVNDPGLLLLGYHRTLKNVRDEEFRALRDLLTSDFHVQELEIRGSQGGDQLVRRLEEMPKGRFAVGLVHSPADVAYLVQDPSERSQSDPRGSNDYSRLHADILGRVLSNGRSAETLDFEHDAEEAVSEVKTGASQAAFLMRALPVDVFENVVKQGHRLPPKSTFFHPKLHSAAVIQSLEGGL